MALYYSKITFTGENNNPIKIRPLPKEVCIRARTMDLATKRIVKYARRFWPYYRFEITHLDSDKVLK